MKAEIEWKDGLTFEGAADSGFLHRMDADEGVGGGNRGTRPMEMIVLGLAGCTGMDVVSILKKKKQPVAAFRVAVDAQRAAEHPKVITAAVIEYFISGSQVDRAAVLRAIELSAVKYCPAQAMLGKVFPIRLLYHLLGDDGVTVLESGEYFPATAKDLA